MPPEHGVVSSNLTGRATSFHNFTNAEWNPLFLRLAICKTTSSPALGSRGMMPERVWA